MAVSRFDESLDIRSFLDIYTNVSLLISMVLTDEQALLFMLHKARHLHPKDKHHKVSSGSEAETDPHKDDHLLLAKAVGRCDQKALPKLPTFDKDSLVRNRKAL